MFIGSETLLVRRLVDVNAHHYDRTHVRSPCSWVGQFCRPSALRVDGPAVEQVMADKLELMA